MTALTVTPLRRRAPRGRWSPPGVVRALPAHAIVAGLCMLWLVPTVGLFVNSFRPPRLVALTGWWTAFLPPWRFTLQNYGEVLGTYNLGRGLLNSLVIAIPGTVIPVAVAALAAYALTWMPFRGRGAMMVLIVGLLVVPVQMTLVPAFALLTRLSLVGTFPAAWLAHTAYGLPLAIYLLRNFMATIPPELIESAEVDGATPLVTFVWMILPLSQPALASLVIFQFLWVWNDLLVALIYVGGRPEVAPMTVLVSNLANSLGQNWQLLTAGAFLSIALPLLVFFAFQPAFARGVTTGALKG
jgi:alpha-glucoside transport system permease protein